MDLFLSMVICLIPIPATLEGAPSSHEPVLNRQIENHIAASPSAFAHALAAAAEPGPQDDRELVSEIVKRFIEALEASKECDARKLSDLLRIRLVVQTLPDKDQDQVVALLLKGIEDSPSRFHEVEDACYVLGFVASRTPQKVVGGLLRLLAKGTTHRGVIAEALGAAGRAAGAARPQLEKLITDRDPAVRARAALALWRTDGKGPQAMKTLKAVLDEERRLFPEGKPPTIRDDFPWYEARGLAIDALGQIGPPAREAVPVLESYLKGDEFGIRQGAAKALFKIDPGHREATNVLLEELKDENSGDVCWQAQAAITLLKTPRYAESAKKALTRIIKEQNLLFYVKALPVSSDERVRLLADALKSKEPAVKQWAAYELGAMGPNAQAALPELRRQENQQDRYTRWGIHFAIKRIQDNAPRP